MPMTATMAPYTLFILDDDTPLNPREDHDCLGKMVCWHSRYSLGEKHDYDEPSDFLRNLLFSEYSSGHDRNNPVFAFLKSGKAKDARLEYNRSTREWELRENQHWSSDSDWYVSSSYAASLKDEVPDWFLDDCLSALTTGELFSLVEQMDGMVILPLYLYDHSGITMNTCGFSCPWDSGQVGWIYADKAMIEQEHGKITPEILEKVRQTLEAEVKEYDYYLTNQCYGFQLFKEDVEVDSCWGFLGEIRDVQDAVKEHLPEDCNPAIVESLQFQYEELDIDEYLERLQEETEELDCEPGYCAYAASCGVIPLAPHTIFTQYLNDAVPEQREQGLRMGHELLERCDELWVMGDTISQGMKDEIGLATFLQLPILYVSDDTSDTIQLVAIPVVSILEATLLAVGACLLATAIPLRKISNMSIVDSIETIE